MKLNTYLMLVVACVAASVLTGCGSVQHAVTGGTGRMAGVPFGGLAQTIGDKFKPEPSLNVSGEVTRPESVDKKTVLVSLLRDGTEGQMAFNEDAFNTTGYFIPRNGRLEECKKRDDAFELPLAIMQFNDRIWRRGVVSQAASAAPVNQTTTVASSQQ